VKGENEAYDSRSRRGETFDHVVDSRRREKLKEGKMGRGGGRTQFRAIFRADFSSCAGATQKRHQSWEPISVSMANGPSEGELIGQADRGG
jgi:hypothetical protein